MSESNVTLVTGATSGIGAATAQFLARRGHRVVLSGRRADQGEALAEAIRTQGGEATFVKADVADPEQVRHLVERALETYGRLDGAFNNAGIEGDTFVPLHLQSADNYRNVFEINVAGVLESLKAEIPALLRTGGGAIVNNASVAGILGFNGMALYTASKHAVVGLTRNAALEYASQGIRVNAVAPGPVETAMAKAVHTPEIRADYHDAIPLNRYGLEEELAEAIFFLCSDRSSYITGQVLAVDGGFDAAGIGLPTLRGERRNG
jgi:NAD(P)-dependent dehydrogenase (short-subunit alcohol dehydrogenase family)